MSGTLDSTDGPGSIDPAAWTKIFAYDAGGPHGLRIGTNNVQNGGNDISTVHGYHVDVIDLGATDVTLSIGASVDNQAGKSAGLAFRVVDSSNFWYVALSATTTSVELRKTVTGTESLVTTSSAVGGLTGTVGVNVFGNTIITMFNGIIQTTSTDSFNNTATKHGVGMRNDPAGSLNQSNLDSWLAYLYP